MNLTDYHSPKGEFPVTRKTLIQRIRSKCPTESEEALNTFFARYWLPMYRYLRALGESREDASDYVQGFVVRELLNREQLRKWEPEEGKLRSFLKSCLDNYRKNAIRHETAGKRGGNRYETHVSLDFKWAESYFQNLSSQGDSPDEQFDKEWCASVVNQAFAKVAVDYQAEGKLQEFQLLLRNLNERADRSHSLSYQEIASRLGISEDLVKYRMRSFKSRFQEALRGVVSELVRPEEVEVEIRYVLRMLGK